MIGQVLHSQVAHGRQVLGVAFGWQAGVGETSQSSDPVKGFWSGLLHWFRKSDTKVRSPRRRVEQTLRASARCSEPLSIPHTRRIACRSGVKV
jgi:hypothetical protein